MKRFLNSLMVLALLMLSSCVIEDEIAEDGNIGDGNTGDSFTKQWGARSGDANSVVIDSSGNVFVSGYTHGDLDGNTNIGDWDAFITKFDNIGNKLWTKQWGTTYWDQSYASAIDSSDNIYVTGEALGAFEGCTHIDSYDIFLTKFDNEGEIVWTKEWGTDSLEGGKALTIDSKDNIYVAGSTHGTMDGEGRGDLEDIFLTKLNVNGKKQWTKQLGGRGYNKGLAVVVDGNDFVYVSGASAGDLDGHTGIGWDDIFLAKYDSSGEKLWTKLWGTSESDAGYSIAVDNTGNIFITGSTQGDLEDNKNAGESDAFLTKLDSDGNRLWTKTWGGEWPDYGRSVTVDSANSVFVTGSVAGDVYLAKYNNYGTKLWTRQWGGSNTDRGNSVAIDSNGYVFVAGITRYDLDGETDVFERGFFLTKTDNDGESLK